MASNSSPEERKQKDHPAPGKVKNGLIHLAKKLKFQLLIVAGIVLVVVIALIISFSAKKRPRIRAEGEVPVTVTVSATTTVGTSIDFTGSATGTITKYEWDFEGDGVYDWESTSTPSTSHAYAVIGKYTPRLRATNDTSQTGTAETTTTVNVRAGNVARLEATGLVGGRNGSSTLANEGDFPKPLHVSSDGTVYIGYVTPGDTPDSKIRIGKSPDKPGDSWSSVEVDQSQVISDVWDSHYDPTITIDEDGYIHAWTVMHSHPWSYWRSKEPNSITGGFDFLGAPQTYNPTADATFNNYTSDVLPGSYISYVRAYRDSNGRIYITWRGRDTDWTRWTEPPDLRTPEGYVGFATYDVNTQTWSYQPDTEAYYNTRGMLVDISAQVVRDPDYCVGKMGLAISDTGRIHAMWVWGKYQRAFDGTSYGHDISYAYSDDLGQTWHKTNGDAYTLPISHATADIIVAGDGSHTDNILAPLNPMVDSNGKLTLIYQGPGSVLYHISLEGGTWSSPTTVSSSASSATLLNDNTFESANATGSLYTSTDGLTWNWVTSSLSWGTTLSANGKKTDAYGHRHAGTRRYILFSNSTYTDANGLTARDIYYDERSSSSNDTPQAYNKSVNVNTNTPTSISLTGHDYDFATSTLAHSIVSQPSHGTLSTITQPAQGYAFATLTYTPQTNYTGSDSFTFKINDGTANSNTATVSITVNANPVLTSPGNKSYTERDSISFALSATDPESDTLTYSASGLPSGATLDSSTGVFSWTPGDTQAGSYNITFSVSDGRGGTDSQTITITVADYVAPNNRPVLSPIDYKTAKAGETCSFSVSATDADNDTLTFAAFNMPRGAQFDPPNRTFNWKPDASQGGGYYIVFRVTDSSGAIHERTTKIEVEVPQTTTTTTPTTTTTTPAPSSTLWYQNILKRDAPSPLAPTYLIIDNSKYEVDQNDMNRFGFNPNYIQTDDSLKAKPDSGTLHKFVQGSDSSAVYFMSGGVKHYIPTVEVLRGLGFSWSQLTILPQSLVDSISTGSDIIHPWYRESLIQEPSSATRFGRLIRIFRSPPTYLIANGCKYSVNTTAMRDFGFDTQYAHVDETIKYWPFCGNLSNLIRDSTGAVYAVSGGVKHHITTPEILQGRQYRGKPVINLPQVMVDSIATGEAISPASAPAPALAPTTAPRPTTTPRPAPTNTIKNWLRRQFQR